MSRIGIDKQLQSARVVGDVKTIELVHKLVDISAKFLNN